MGDFVSPMRVIMIRFLEKRLLGMTKFGKRWDGKRKKDRKKNRYEFSCRRNWKRDIHISLNLPTESLKNSMFP